MMRRMMIRIMEVMIMSEDGDDGGENGGVDDEENINDTIKNK